MLLLFNSFLLSCNETDELLVFYDSVLPSNYFTSLVGRYKIDNEENKYYRLSSIHDRLYYEFCKNNKLLKYNFIVSEVPEQRNLYVAAFPSYATAENMYFLLKIIGNDLHIWGAISDGNIAKDHFPESIEGNLYSVEDVQDFLNEYGNVYTQTNESVVFEYLDDRELSCN